MADLFGGSLEDSIGRPVAITQFFTAGGRVTVSTVFLGVDHGFGAPGGPVLFETEVCGVQNWHSRWRYRTPGEAAAGHAAAVAEAVSRIADWTGQEAS